MIDLKGCEMLSLLIPRVGQTLAMAMYSMSTDIRFMMKMTRRARRGLNPSIRAIESGPRSLQARSIRRICELSTWSVQYVEFTGEVGSSQRTGYQPSSSHSVFSAITTT